MKEQDLEFKTENTQEILVNRRIRQTGWIVIGVLAIFLLGLGSGYRIWGQDEISAGKLDKQVQSLYEQVNPKAGYNLAISYGDLGPRLIESGVINYDAFALIYENAGNPLSEKQIEILQNGSDDQIVISAENAHFLLNYFWAVGLANRNPILTQGPMVQYSDGKIEGFASTGGWGLASKPIGELYANLDLIPLTTEQQKLVEQVAMQIHRPCCDNHTAFPDCNHGMAMLGILQLMASKGATADEMFEAAKYINAYWFPQQALETALYLHTNQNLDFIDADARLVVGSQLSSASGARIVRADLQAKGLLQQSPGQGGSCAN